MFGEVRLLLSINFDFIEFFIASFVIILSKRRTGAGLGWLYLKLHTKLSTRFVDCSLCRLRHNRTAFHLRGVTICFPSYKPRAGQYGP